MRKLKARVIMEVEGLTEAVVERQVQALTAHRGSYPDAEVTVGTVEYYGAGYVEEAPVEIVVSPSGVGVRGRRA